MQNSSEKKVGPIIGALVIVVLLVIAAFYTWGNRLNQTATPADQQSATSTASTTGSTATVQVKMSASDDVDSLSKDIDTIDATSGAAF